MTEPVEPRQSDGLPRRLAYQRAWCAETARFAVCEKARRIGLSWGDAAERVLHAGEGRGDVYYQSYNKDMTETYIGDCADWVGKLNVAAGQVLEETLISDDEEQIARFRIDFDSGKKIVALSSNPRVLRSKGKPGDVVVLDEAAFCDDLPELLKAAAAVTQWGGKVRIISTHSGDDNPFNELVTDIRAGRHPQYALHRITLDDAIADGLARRVFSVTQRDWYAGAARDWRDEILGGYTSRDAADEELFCIPRQGGGAYFPRILIESCMADAAVIRFTGTTAFNQYPEPVRRAEMADWLKENLLPLLLRLDPERRHAFGMDFARSGDLSVIAPLELGETLKRRCPFLLELQNVPHLQQVQALTYLGDRLPRLCAGAIDAGGNGSFIAEAAVDHYGSMIEGVKFTETWYREQMPKYKAAFEDGAIEIPRNDEVLEDHRAIRLVRGVPRLPAGKTDGKGERHGDSAIALALAYTAADQARGPIEYRSAGPTVAASVLAGFTDERLDLSGYLQ